MRNHIWSIIKRISTKIFDPANKILQNSSNFYKLHQYPTRHPKYTSVSPARLKQYPYSFIAPIYGKTHDDVTHFLGTGWLWSGGLVITAAHVLESVQRASCVLYNEVEFYWDHDIWFNPQYIKTVNGKQYYNSGSPYDFAVLKPAKPLTRSFGGIDITLGSSELETNAIGFTSSAVLVEHAGMAERHGSYYVHTSHTDNYHSGCPIVHNNKAVGIHLGGIDAALAWETIDRDSIPRGSNAALAFTEKQLQYFDTFK